MGKKLIIGLIVIMVLAIAGVGIFTAIQLTNQPEPVATPMAIATPIATLSPTPTPNLCVLEFSLGTATATPRSSSTPVGTSKATSTPASTAKASASPLALGGLPTTSPTTRPSTSPVSSASPKSTSTASAIAAASPTAKPQATLPVAGVGLPTIIGVLMGLLLLVGAFILAL